MQVPQVMVTMLSAIYSVQSLARQLLCQPLSLFHISNPM